MINRNLREMLFAVALSTIISCGPSPVTQGDQDKTKPQNVAQAGVSSAATIVLGVRQEAPPPPPAPPAGTPARPRLATPASYYEPVSPFFFYVETLTSTGPSKYGFIPTQPCIQSGVFKRGMRLVVRFEILDTSTGKRITDKDGATIKLVLPHGEEIPGRWTIRGGVNALPDSAWMWDTSWDIPPDYPLGSFDYRITIATKDGRKTTFSPPIQKATTADSRVRIID
jgi:hypothetical protein